jgi:hypothetical protein
MRRTDARKCFATGPLLKEEIIKKEKARLGGCRDVPF